MTEALVILLATLVATGLLVLGVLELVAPTRRRVRRRPSAPPPRPAPRPIVPPPRPEPPREPIEVPRVEPVARAEIVPPVAPVETARDAPPPSEVAAAARRAAEQAGAGDADGAMATLRTAIAAAPAEARDHRREELVSTLVQAVLAGADTLTDSRVRLDTLAAARRVLAAAVADASAPAGFEPLVTDLADRYWATYDTVVTLCIEQRRFADAYELFDRASADPDAPRARLAEWRARTVRTEVGALAADAIRAVQEGRDEAAAASLDHADALLATASTVVDEGGELARRLWRAHSRLGLRRIETGDHDGALGALYRALELSGGHGSRWDETCEAIARAVDGVVDERVSVIRGAAAGNRESARAQADRLAAVVQHAVDAGVPPAAIARSRSVVQELVETLAG